MGELAEQSAETFTHECVTFSSFHHKDLLTQRCINRERREHSVFQRLLEMVPGLEERLVDASDESVAHIAELVSGHPLPIHAH